MKFYAAYQGPKETRYTLHMKDAKVTFPYQVPIEVDKDTAKYLKGLKKYRTDDSRFKITMDKSAEDKDE
jgi:hypothetical protein